MATVRNTIALNDKMSPVLKTVVKSLSSTVDALAKVDGISDSTFAAVRRDVQAAQSAIDALGNEIDTLPQHQEKVRRGFAGWQAAIVTANQAIQLIKTGVQTVSRGLYALSDMTDLQERLVRMAGTEMTVYELQDKIAKAADATRASYEATASSSMAMYNNLKHMGVTQTQAIRLAEILNKQLGADSVKGVAYESTVYQLGQSLASGKLRYEDWRLVLQNAPGMVERIAKAAGKTTAEFNAMVSNGEVSAAQFANYLAASGAEIDAMYDDMADTFYDQMNRMKTAAKQELMGQGGLHDTLSSIFTSDGWNKALEGAMDMMRRGIAWANTFMQNIKATISDPAVQATLLRWLSGFLMIVSVLGVILNAAVDVVGFIVANWSLIGPIVWGIVAALTAYKTMMLITAGITLWTSTIIPALTTAIGFLRMGYGVLTGSTAAASAAQLMFNSALWASPLPWIIMLIIAVIAVIYLVVAAINKVTGSTISATGIIIGAIAVLGAFIWNTIVGVINAVIQFLWGGFVDPWISIIEWVLNVFNGGFNSFGDAVKNLLGNIISWFLNLGKVVTKIIDAIFGTNWTSGLNALQDKVLSWGKNDKAITLDRGNAPTIDSRIAYGSAWDAGYGAGQNLGNKVSNMFSGGKSNLDKLNIDNLNGAAGAALDLADMANNGGIKTQGEVTISDEDIKYLKDVAKTEWTNKFTTLRPEMTVTFGDVRETADVNQLLTTMEDMIANAYASALVG